MDATTNSRTIWEGRRAALVIAHPGHELLVHNWLEEAKPIVFVLTTGVATDGEPAVSTTAQIIEKAGGRASKLFGRFTDRGFQQALMMREQERFHALAQEMADSFIQEEIDVVVGDSAEGFDPAHDLCRVLVDAALALTARVRPHLRNFEFPLIGGRISRGAALRLRLDKDAWARKNAALKMYEQRIEEVERRISREGPEAMREECVRLATPWSLRDRRDILYGHARNGVISAVQFTEHVLPIAGSVQRFVNGPHFRAA